MFCLIKVQRRPVHRRAPPHHQSGRIGFESDRRRYCHIRRARLEPDGGFAGECWVWQPINVNLRSCSETLGSLPINLIGSSAGFRVKSDSIASRFLLQNENCSSDLSMFRCHSNYASTKVLSFFFRWDVSIICPTIALKLAVTIFPSLPFLKLWPNWLDFFSVIWRKFQKWLRTSTQTLFCVEVDGLLGAPRNV